MDRDSSSSEGISASRLPRALLLYLIFVAICFGLGYPILNRYDPRATAGVVDVRGYASVVNPAEAAPELEILKHRIVVPWLAKPFFRMAEGRVGTWDPVLFGLLVSSSMFTAGAALLLYRIVVLLFGVSFEREALIASLLFLTNFAVPNYFLAGLIDSGEAFFALVLTLALLAGRFRTLPLVTAAGCLAKETFLPLGSIFMLAWWMADRRRDRRQLLWIGIAVLASIATVVAALSIREGNLTTPLDFAASLRADDRPESSLSAARDIITSRGPYFVFGWLLPIGIWRLNRLPRAWIAGAGASAIAIILLGIYDNSGSNIDRSLFTFAGPLLAASAALFLARAGVDGTKSRLPLK